MKQLNLIAPTALDARIQLPSSKSLCNRALVLHALAKGQCLPGNLSDCDDTRVMVRALREMTPVIDILAAGTAMRFLTAYLSVTPGTHVLTGTERMRQRPIRILVDALRQLGARIDYVENEGFPPLRVTGGTLHERRITLPGNVSSQYISALLMIAPVLENGLTLTLTGEIVSRPYIDMTLRLMREFGASACWTAENELQVDPQSYCPTPYTVESDWSAASYWYELLALAPQGGTVVLPGLKADSPQGDARIAKLFLPLGVATEFTAEGVRLTRTARTAERMDTDFTHQPDMAQTFVVTCALLGVPFRFSGLQSLKIKETDRMAALIAEMRKLGYVLHESDGSVLSWDGGRCPEEKATGIDTYEDHRMALAFAPAAFLHEGLRINRPDVVSKSYPHYWEDLEKAGFRLEEKEVEQC